MVASQLGGCRPEASIQADVQTAAAGWPSHTGATVMVLIQEKEKANGRETGQLSELKSMDGTVEPLSERPPHWPQNVVCQNRWSLVTGSVIY